MEIIDNHGFFRIEKDSPLIGKDKVRITRNDNPEKFIELTTDQMTPNYLASRLSQLGIKNVDLSKLDLNQNGTIETVSELSELDAVLEKNKEFLNSREIIEHVSSNYNNPDFKQTLFQAIDNGLDVNAKNGYGNSLLMSAIECSKEKPETLKEIIKFLIEKGADVNSKNENGSTALSYVAEEKYPNLVKFLIEKGADVNNKDINDKTPLMWAGERGCLENISLLIEKGADVNAKDNDGWTALMGAARASSPEKVKLLLEKGAQVNAKDNYGRTALMDAVSGKSLENIKLLIEKGADLSIKDKSGNTVINYTDGSVELIELLEKAMKKNKK